MSASGPTHVIATASFVVDPAEDESTSYRVYGRALARWLAGRLRETGQPVEDVMPKSFGWCVLVKSEPFALWVACSNLDGATLEWSARVIAEPSLMQATFERASVTNAVDKLSTKLAELMPTAPGVTRHWVD